MCQGIKRRHGQAMAIFEVLTIIMLLEQRYIIVLILCQDLVALTLEEQNELLDRVLAAYPNDKIAKLKIKIKFHR